MANIVDTEFQVFVTYEINPIPQNFEDSLRRHLLTKVWGNDHWADEDITVVVSSVNGKPMVNKVCYQFGERYDGSVAEEIGDLIDEQVNVWASENPY